MATESDERPRGATAVLLYLLVPLGTAWMVFEALNGNAGDARVVFCIVVGTAVMAGTVHKWLTTWRKKS